MMRSNRQEGSHTLVIGADHAGFSLKEAVKKHLTSEGFKVQDIGCYDENRVDYPSIAETLVNAMQSMEENDTQGILICGSGIGVSIAANRFPGIRAALVHEPVSAKLSRQHNDANVLCLGARLVTPELAYEIIHTWLETPFEGGRHQQRIAQLDQFSSPDK